MVEIVNYSEKSIAVIGDTKGIKEQLKSAKGRFNPRLSCGAGWIFSVKQLGIVKQICDEFNAKGVVNSIPKATKSTHKSYKIKDNSDLMKEAELDNWDIQFYSHICKLPNGCIVAAEKKRIETAFWFAEGSQCGTTFEEAQNLAYAASKSEQWFIDRNTSGLNYIIEQLKEQLKGNYLSDYNKIVLRKHNYKNLCEITTLRFYPDRANCYELTNEDLIVLIDFYESVKADFEKRLQTYLKRYGLKKCSFQTYWADR